MNHRRCVATPRAYVDPATVGAVGRLSTGAVVGRGMEALDGSPCVVIGRGLAHGVVQPLVMVVVTVPQVSVFGLTLRQGDHADRLAVAYGVGLGHGVGAHPVLGGGLDVVHHIDGRPVGLVVALVI